MRHRKAKITLDRNARQRRPLFRNLVIALIEKERIVTTLAKGKAARAMAERIITRGKLGRLHDRREIISKLNNAKAADKVVKVLAPRFAKRNGGYTRMTKLTPRSGDAAEMVVVEIIGE